MLAGGVKRAALVCAIISLAIGTTGCKPSGPDKYNSDGSLASVSGSLGNPTNFSFGDPSLDLFNTAAADGSNAPLAQTSRTGVSHTVSVATTFDRPTSSDDTSPVGGNVFELFIENVAGGSEITVNNVGSMQSGLAAPSSEGPIADGATIGANDPFRAEQTDSLNRLQSISSFDDVVIDNNTQFLQDTQYGLFNNRYARNTLMTNFNFFSTGNATQAMPIAGNATYRGTFYGYASTPSGSNGPVFIDGDATLVADFNTGTVGGLVENIDTLSGSQNLGADIGFNGTIAGNQFVGTAAYIGVGTSTTSGSANGQFNGVGATEVGGSLLVAGDVPGYDPNGLSDTTTVGSFGAIRQP